MHKNINAALVNFNCFNNSSESWYDRLAKETVHNTKLLNRNETEFFKYLLFWKDEDKEIIKRLSVDDKIYLGAGKWRENNAAVLNCSTHTDKKQGIMTVILHVLQDIRVEKTLVYRLDLSNSWANKH